MSEGEYLYFLVCIWLCCLTVLMIDPLSEIGEASAFGALMSPLVSAFSYFYPLPAELPEFMQVPETWLTPAVSAGMLLISVILLLLRSRFIEDCE